MSKKLKINKIKSDGDIIQLMETPFSLLCFIYFSLFLPNYGEGREYTEVNDKYYKDFLDFLDSFKGRKGILEPINRHTIEKLVPTSPLFKDFLNFTVTDKYLGQPFARVATQKTLFDHVISLLFTSYTGASNMWYTYLLYLQQGRSLIGLELYTLANIHPEKTNPDEKVFKREAIITHYGKNNDIVPFSSIYKPIEREETGIDKFIEAFIKGDLLRYNSFEEFLEDYLEKNELEKALSHSMAIRDLTMVSPKLYASLVVLRNMLLNRYKAKE